MADKIVLKDDLNTRDGQKRTLKKQLTRLVGAIVIPLSIVIVILLIVLAWYSYQYDSILFNLTSASAFNQDFKSDVDLKMFYYVSDSAYADGIPIDEVESARELAEELLENTTEKKSIEAIESVRDLCITLEERMNDIDEAETYDERVSQLENNIYILTDLIQTYMYNYLYYESVHLSYLQQVIKAQVKVIFIMTILAIVLLILGLIHYANRVTRRITLPISSMTERVRSISSGDFSTRPPIEARVEELQTLSNGFEDMVGRLNRLIEENKKAESQKRHAELELLQAQINPHFLYNTLDTIIWLIESGDKEKSIDMVSNLSGFFRSSLSKGRDVITLAEEKNHVLSYLAIQKTRYQDRMDFEIDIPESLNDYLLPKLTLQPLVENSIYHGIKLQREKGQIRVTAMDIGDKIELKVSDNGAGMTESRLEELREAMRDGNNVGFGLRTVHKRLQLLFGEEFGLSIQSTDTVGTIVTAVIPKTKEESEEETDE